MSAIAAILRDDERFRYWLAVGAVGFTLAVVSATLILDSLLLPVLAILGAVTLWVIIRRPDLGLYLLLFITYLRLSDVAIRFHGAPSVAKFYVVGLLGVVLYRVYAHGDRPSGWRSAFILLTLYGLVQTLSLLFARDLDLAFTGLESYAKNCIIALAITLLLDRPDRLRPAVWSLLAAGAVMAFLTVWQVLTGTFESNYGGLAQVAMESSILAGQQGNRAQGPIGDPNFYSQVLLILLPLALDRAWHDRRYGLRLLGLGISFLIILANVFTYSRGGFLAMVVVLVIMLWRNPPRPIVLIFSLAILLMALPFTPSQYAERMATSFAVVPDLVLDEPLQADGAIVSRLSEMAAAGAVFLDNPIVGVGLDNYALYYPEYSELVGIDPNRSVRSAHDLYLEILAETGLIGMLVYTFLLVTLFRGLALANRRFQQLGAHEYSSISFAIGVAIIGYLVTGLFLHAGHQRYWWTLAGIALSLPEVSRHFLLQRQQAQEST